MIEKPNIYKEFYNLLAQIPEGCVSTYGDMAIQLGDIISARAVGEMLSENQYPDIFPCYRVVMSDGSLGGFTHPDGVKEKIRRLKNSGVRISNGKIENFDRIRFRDFRSNHPLKKFRDQARRTRINGSEDFSDGISSMDISYHGRIGVGVVVDFEKQLNYEIVESEVNSPYIPNYLYLREGAIYEALARKGRLNIIDGNGVLHRDRRGVATLVGVSKRVATLGIAKSLLMGDEKEDGIYIGADRVGMRVGKHFVSEGYGVSIGDSVTAVMKDTNFPQTRYADRLSRRYRNEILSARNSI